MKSGYTALSKRVEKFICDLLQRYISLNENKVYIHWIEQWTFYIWYIVHKSLVPSTMFKSVLFSTYIFSSLYTLYLHSAAKNPHWYLREANCYQIFHFKRNPLQKDRNLFSIYICTRRHCTKLNLMYNEFKFLQFFDSFNSTCQNIRIIR